MSGIAYYNGVFGAPEEMTVSLLDRAVCFGDGCYEAALVIGGKALDMKDHLDRFENSLRLMQIQPKETREEMEAILQECIDRLGEPYAMVYWQISRGTAPRNHAFPPAGTPSNLMVTVTPKPGMPKIHEAKPMITVEDTRYMHCNIKTLNLFPNVMANEKAHAAGAFEAIFIRPDGFVTEGSHTNIMILKDGKLITHEDGKLILPGVTKKELLVVARGLGIPVEERAFTKEELMDADEVFATSSTTFTKRCCSIDGIPCAMRDEALYNKLADAFYQRAIEVTK